MEPNTNSAQGLTQSPKQNPYIIPISIVVAGALIAGAVFFNGNTAPGPAVYEEEDTTSNLAAINPIDASDHVRGNPNAPVKLVVYSDLECPFCINFHGTLLRIVEEYGKSGKVALVYRHFPIEQNHKKAKNEAHASECVAELGGNEKFWVFIDELFRITPGNDGLDPKMLPQLAKLAGVDEAKFNTCMQSGRHMAKIEKDYANAIATGPARNGTPWSIVVSPKGNYYPINGAQDYTFVKQVIDEALEN